MVQKYKLKRFIGLLVAVLAVAGFLGAIGLATQVVIFTGTGADPRTALNLIPAIPPDLENRVVWLEDAPAARAGRALEPVVRQQITGAYLRAWAQLGVSYQVGHPYGMGTYFRGPALVQMNETISATLAAGWSIDQSNLFHTLELTQYTDDGSVVAFTDRNARLVQHVTHQATQDEYVVLTDNSYDVVMVQEDGNWRIRAWRRQGPGELARANTSILPGAVTVSGTQLIQDGQPFPIVGVNYYPSATPWTLFWSTYDPVQTAADLAEIRGLGANTVRIFVPFEDFGGETVDPAALNKLRDLLDQAGAQGLKVIVTLFDHRTDHNIANWAADSLHLAGLVPALAWHPALLAWDLKNEPDRDVKLNGKVLNEAWLRFIAGEVRRHDPHHLVTIGWTTPAAATALADQVDFVSYHYYGSADDYGEQLAALAAAVPEKPLVLGEYGKTTWQWFLPKSMTEASQVDYIEQLLAVHRAGPTAGDILWTVYDFTQVPLAEFMLPWRKAAQANMGVIRVDGTQKPAATLLAR